MSLRKLKICDVIIETKYKIRNPDFEKTQCKVIWSKKSTLTTFWHNPVLIQRDSMSSYTEKWERYTTNRNHTQSRQCSSQTQFPSLLYDCFLPHVVLSVLIADSVHCDMLSSISMSLDMFKKYFRKIQEILSKKISSYIFENFENFFLKILRSISKNLKNYSEEFWELFQKN